ncbi:MAG: hypothetical protein Q7S14_02575 [bacterium]|nr:hypothetical protein [bacterium]
MADELIQYTDSSLSPNGIAHPFLEDSEWTFRPETTYRRVHLDDRFVNKNHNDVGGSPMEIEVSRGHKAIGRFGIYAEDQEQDAKLFQVLQPLQNMLEAVHRNKSHRALQSSNRDAPYEEGDYVVEGHVEVHKKSFASTIMTITGILVAIAAMAYEPTRNGIVSVFNVNSSNPNKNIPVLPTPTPGIPYGALKATDCPDFLRLANLNPNRPVCVDTVCLAPEKMKIDYFARSAREATTCTRQ